MFLKNAADGKSITKIEITIPVLNEEETLQRQIEMLHFFIKENLQEFDVNVVIADNGSTDATLEIASQLSKKIDGVNFISLAERGVGRALKASWGSSAACIIGYMDLDFATDLEFVRKAVMPIVKGEADVVTGSRLLPNSKVIGRSFLRSITSRCFNIILRFLFETKVSDGMCGFKFLKKECFDKILFGGAQSDGWFFATELLLVSEHIGLRVKSIPVTWRDDPNSKVKIIRLSLEYIKQMLELRNRLVR